MYRDTEIDHGWVQLPTFYNKIQEGYAKCFHCEDIVEDERKNWGLKMKDYIMFRVISCEQTTCDWCDKCINNGDVTIFCDGDFYCSEKCATTRIAIC